MVPLCSKIQAVAHTFNLSTWEAEAEAELWIPEFEASLVYKMSPGQPELPRETLSQKTKMK